MQGSNTFDRYLKRARTQPTTTKRAIRICEKNINDYQRMLDSGNKAADNICETNAECGNDNLDKGTEYFVDVNKRLQEEIDKWTDFKEKLAQIAKSSEENQ